MTIAPFADAVEHLTAELERLELLLRRQVLRLRAAHVLTEDEFRGLYVSDAQVDALLRRGLLERTPVTGETGVDIATLSLQLYELQAIIQSRVESSSTAGIRLPLVELSDRLGLNSFERCILILASAPEFDQRYEVLYSYAQNDITRKRPTVALARSLFSTGFRDAMEQTAAFCADAPLLGNGLITLSSDGREHELFHASHSIRTDHRVARFLLGKQELDEKLVPFTRFIREEGENQDLILTEAQQQELEHISRALRRQPGTVLIEGGSGSGKLAAARAICRRLSMPILCADLGILCLKTDNLPELATVLVREALFTGSAIHLRHFEALLAHDDTTLVERTMAAFAWHSGPLFLGSQKPWRTAASAGCKNRLYHLNVPLPEFPERVRLWERELCCYSQGAPCEEIDLKLLADKFALTPGQIEAATRYACQIAELREAGKNCVSEEELHLSARYQSSQELRRLAQKITPARVWQDIVLPQRTLQQLREISLHVKYRHVVYGEWGFDRRLSMGKGLKAMFCGSSGVGKTMAAEVLANDLGLDLYKIDLSMVVSKYIGETEKNLSAIFREGESSNAMLFFDEADALFGKRSEIQDAHDRYANVEVSYLLQRMEEYQGIVILATNLSKNVDEAFARRLHHVVDFPFPDASHRETIWKGMFPEPVPLGEDVDLNFLARQFEFAGGNIRNVAVSAAFLAAQNGGRITMEHLVQATARELSKLGRLPLKSSFREYFELIREGA